MKSILLFEKICVGEGSYLCIDVWVKTLNVLRLWRMTSLKGKRWGRSRHLRVCKFASQLNSGVKASNGTDEERNICWREGILQVLMRECFVGEKKSYKCWREKGLLERMNNTSAEKEKAWEMQFSLHVSVQAWGETFRIPSAVSWSQEGNPVFNPTHRTPQNFKSAVVISDGRILKTKRGLQIFR